MTADPITIDAHAHVFHRGLQFAAGRRYTPGYDAPLEDYLEKLDRNGLSHGVLVQPSFLGTDNSYLVDCLRRANTRLRGVAVVAPAISHDELLRLHEAGVVGIRLNLVGQPIPNLGSSPWMTLLESITELGWHVEVQRSASDVGPVVSALLDAKVSVVLDHFGLPDEGACASDPGLQTLLAFGRSRHVWVKLSAPYRLGHDGVRLARLLYPRLRDAFGLDRLMWGSDWPHTQYEDRESYENSRRLIADACASPADIAAVLASSRELFRF